jgi:hypothetical protein
MAEVTDEPLYRDRVCGTGIGKAELYATIRLPSDKDPARRASETRRFAATKRGVLALADWLRCWQVAVAARKSVMVVARTRSSSWPSPSRSGISYSIPYRPPPGPSPPAPGHASRTR